MIRTLTITAKEFVRHRSKYETLDGDVLRHIKHGRYNTEYLSVNATFDNPKKCHIIYKYPKRASRYYIHSDTQLLLFYGEPEKPKPFIPEKKHETFEQLVNRVAPARYPNLAERYS